MAAGDVKVYNTTNRSFKCYQCNGTNTKIDITSSNSKLFLDVNIPFSISCWVKNNIADADMYGIIGKYTATGNQRSVALCKNNTTKFLFFVNTDGTGTGGKYAGEPNIIINDNRWHHLVGLWDGTNIKAYTDTIVGTSAATSTVFHGTEIFTIGKCLGATNGNWKGQIANIQFFQKALTTTEINKLYQCQNVDNCTHKYNFQDNNYNDSIGSYNGTNSNGFLTIADDAIAAQVKAQRVASTDKWLIAKGAGGQVITANIE